MIEKVLKWSIAAVAIFIVGYLVYDYIGANDKQEDNPLFLPKFEFEGVLEDKISSQQIAEGVLQCLEASIIYWLLLSIFYQR